MVYYGDEQVFITLASAAEWWLSDLNLQGAVNVTRTFATLHCRDEKQFAALVRAAERELSDFNLVPH